MAATISATTAAIKKTRASKAFKDFQEAREAKDSCANSARAEIRSVAAANEGGREAEADAEMAAVVEVGSCV